VKPEIHYKRTVEPDEEPVSIEELLDEHIHGANADDDEAYAQRLIRAARVMFEDHTGLALFEQTWQVTLSHFVDRLKIRKPPLRSIESITYYDEVSEQQTLASSIYRVSAHEDCAILELDYDQSWPSTEACRHDAVTITFQAGIYPEADGVDNYLARKFEMAQHAIRLLAGEWYEFRLPVASVALHKRPLSYDSLVTQCRVEW